MSKMQLTSGDDTRLNGLTDMPNIYMRKKNFFTCADIYII